MREELLGLSDRRRLDLAFDYFVDELDGYIQAMMDEGYTWDAAVSEAMFEYDEFWKACKNNYGA